MSHTGVGMLRVGIIDDRSLSRAGLRGMLHSLAPETLRNSRPSIVAEGKRAHAAALVRATRPDLLVCGDRQGKDSLALLDAVTRLPAIPTVLVITENITERATRALLTRGAAGVLLHRSAHQHLTWALTAVTQGSRALSPEIVDAIIRGCSAPPRSGPGAHERVAGLSAREREVLALLSDGLPNRAIAQALHISPETVKDHIRALCCKLRVDNRMHAARIAWQTGVAG
ncbi:winged helix-turn-helix transcriptional regulator [Streptomyces sp. SID685]|uniref:LuxR C-terminal-related transcriptional regulator n=1 Tax=Streptomyces sp. SID685 TaxID=2690322 RepID=UPI001368E4CA|nr:winged helix-turn-helix transcriptional regulator [Streptomyces sp. SID685]